MLVCGASPYEPRSRHYWPNADYWFRPLLRIGTSNWDGVEAPSKKARPGTSLAAQSADLHGAFLQEGPVRFAAGRGFCVLCSQANSGLGKSET
jgi:hypothetical protein